jgi:hypothetical protein
MWRTRNMAVLLCVRKCLFSHSVLNISFESTLALSLTRVNTNTHKTSSVTHMKSRDWTHCMSCPPPRLCLATGEAQGEFVQSATRSPPLVPQEGPLLVCQAGRVWALTRRNGTPHQTYSYIRMLRTDHSADYYRYCTRSDDSGHSFLRHTCDSAMTTGLSRPYTTHHRRARTARPTPWRR